MIKIIKPHIAADSGRLPVHPEALNLHHPATGDADYVLMGFMTHNVFIDPLRRDIAADPPEETGILQQGKHPEHRGAIDLLASGFKGRKKFWKLEMTLNGHHRSQNGFSGPGETHGPGFEIIGEKGQSPF